LFFFFVFSKETRQYLYVSYGLFNVMYLFVSGIQYRDMLCYLQVAGSSQDNAMLVAAMLPNF